MSAETDIGIDDYDALIEYCPESPEVIDNPSHHTAMINEDSMPPRIISVCILCFRQYDLVEDLRGHMIEYHKYVPIEEDITDNTKTKCDANKSEPTKTVEKPQEISTAVPIVVLPECQDVLEIKPVPFKDFRLLLRRNMNLKCTAFSSCAYKFETLEKLENHKMCHLESASSFKCFSCSLELNNWRRCSAHMWKSHKLDIDLLKCPVCEFKSHASGKFWVQLN